MKKCMVKNGSQKVINMIGLQLVSRSHKDYQDIRDRHYVENHGCIGRQLHYLVKMDDKTIGIISGASAVWACKPRDDFFGINKDNRIKEIGKIINNVVFRLEYNQPNLGSQILSMWRKQVVIDWNKRYNDMPVGFETFVFGENRNGRMYRADNWKEVGITQGSAKYKPHGAYGVGERKITDKKIILCKKIKENW